ncbi:MAG: SIR2 family protein [Gammaproteobacteria bacterium]|nr:SIR2 family protein [Gammaproteobacteria bacterium]
MCRAPVDLIPEKLRQSLEDREVVFFCGAGVSKGAGLPSFEGLVKSILTDLLPPKDNCKPGSMEALTWETFDQKRYDEALSILETPNLDGYDPKKVRERVRYYLSKQARALHNHETLVRLADLDSKDGRLVTTNFDTLFERAYRKLRRDKHFDREMTVSVAPALPPAKPKTFKGLVYLHGRLGSSPVDRELVLTTGDFGMAYMLEGWALRFVVELFRHFHVVFIGYSLEDPTMSYLVRALAVARERDSQQFKEPFAFTSYESNADSGTREKSEREWKLSGITPLPFDKKGNYDAFWTELEAWANDHRQGISDRKQKVALLGQNPPASSEEDTTVREMVWALKDPKVAKYFADLNGDRRPSPEWIPHLQKQGLFCLPTGRKDDGKEISVSLVARQLNDYGELHPATHQLGRWVCNCLESQAAIDWVLREGAVLHVEMRNFVQQELKHKEGTGFPSYARKLWQVLADYGYSHMLSERIVSDDLDYGDLVRVSSSVPLSTLTFLNRVRPIPTFKVKPDYLQDERNQNPECPSDWYEIEMELVGIKEDHEFSDYQEQSEDWTKSLAMMADDLTTRLNEAMVWFHEFGMANEDFDKTYSQYPSVSQHKQNEYAPIWTHLIGLVRDSRDALLACGDQAAESRLVGRWRSLPYPIFRRLVLYTSTEPSDADIDGGMEILLDGSKPALWDIYTLRETSRFLRKRGADITSDRLARLIEAILQGPPEGAYSAGLSVKERENWRDRAILLRLYKLIESGARLPQHALETYEHIRGERQWNPCGDQSEEFVVFGSSNLHGFRFGDGESLENFAGMTIEQFLKWSETQAQNDSHPWDCGGGWAGFVKKDFSGALRLLRDAAARGVWPIPPWYMILSEWNQNKGGKQLDEGQKEVAILLSGMSSQALTGLADQAARWLENNRLRLGKRLRQQVWRRIWKASLNSAAPSGDLNLDTATTHAGGILGKVLYQEMAEQIPKALPGQNTGFPRLLKLDFNRLVASEDPSVKLARVSMAPMLFALFRIDPDWTQRTFFVRMDPEDQEMFDPYLWEAYFLHLSWTSDLLKAFKSSFLKVLKNLDLIPIRVHSKAIRVFVHMAIPIGRGIDTVEAKDVLWQLSPRGLIFAAMALRDILQGADKKSSTLWRETVGPWFKEVWPTRPKDRSPELSRWLAWMASETDAAFPEAVETIKDVLMQEEYSSVLRKLIGKEKDCKLVRRYPCATLILMHRVVHDESDEVSLESLVGMITEAQPGINDNELFQELNDRLG